MALSTTHVIENMEPFDPERGDDWPMYTEWMEQYFVANGIEGEAKKRAVFLTVILVAKFMDYYEICWHWHNWQRLSLQRWPRQ